MFYKLYEIGIGGKFIKLIQSIYKNNVLQVKVGKNKISNAFTATVGARQDDNLSPNLFNIFINDAFDKDSCDPIQLGSAYLEVKMAKETWIQGQCQEVEACLRKNNIKKAY